MASSEPSRTLLVFCLLIPSLFAQTRTLSPSELPASAFQLKSITVTGSKRYKPEDIIAATGLQIGGTVHEDDLRAAARVLSDSGAFTDVSFKFSFSNPGTDVEFQVKDSSDFVPAHFENFVWFSNSELNNKLHAEVPLFHGELPVHGGMADKISLALQAMLIDAKVEGSADYTRLGPEGGPTEAFDFEVSGPHIDIQEVRFEGVEPAMNDALGAAARKLEGREFTQTTVRKYAETNFLPCFLSQGYLKAVLGAPEAKVVKTDADEIDVEVSFRPVRGPQYKLSALTISGNNAVPLGTLEKLMPASTGAPINVVQLQNEIGAMRQLYASYGYMAVDIKPHEDIDNSALSVKFAVDIIEGPVYKMGDLDIQGLDAATRAKLQTEWTMRGGDTYNSAYTHEFVKKAEDELGDWNITVHESVNAQDKTVDVTLRFDPRN